MITFNDQKTTLTFSVSAYAAWAPGLESAADWQAWALHQLNISGSSEPPLQAMPSLLRRRANMPGKMALEVALSALCVKSSIPTLFCSRHGECARALSLLTQLSQAEALSPTTFSLSVHNAIGGLLSIARAEHTNSLALAAGHSTIEHAVIEACGLLADGESAVLLITYDSTLPILLSDYAEGNEQPYAWAWLIEPPGQDTMSLSWQAAMFEESNDSRESAGLEIFRFFLNKSVPLQRSSNGQRWQWAHHA